MITERERQREYCESCTSYVTKHDKEEIEVYSADEDFFFLGASLARLLVLICFGLSQPIFF